MLWTSDTQFGVNSATIIQTTFMPGGLALDAGGTYIAIMSGAGLYSSGGFSGQQGSVASANPANGYAGGQGYGQRISDPGVNALVNSAFTPYFDLAFRANFGPAETVVPEPRSVLLLAVGLIFLGFVGQRGLRASA